MRGPKEDDLLDEQLSHPVTDIAAAASSPDSDVSSPTGSPTGKRAGSWELAESGGARHVHQSTIPHPNLHQLHGEVLPVPVLLSRSPFAPLAKDLAAKDKDVLEKLSKAFVMMRFGRGDVLPSSPFYLVARGTVFVRVVSGELPVATKCARPQRHPPPPARVSPCPPVRSPRMPRAHVRSCVPHVPFDARLRCGRRAGCFINWCSEFSSFPRTGAIGSTLLGCLPNGATNGAARDPQQMELVGASDGHVALLTARSMQAFVDSGAAAAALIQRASQMSAVQMPMVAKAKLEEAPLRTLSALCSFRYVAKGDPVFHHGELGRSCAVVVSGVLQPACHGPVAAALGFSKAETHWKALHDVTSMLGLARSLGRGLKNKQPSTPNPPAAEGGAPAGSAPAGSAAAGSAAGAPSGDPLSVSATAALPPSERAAAAAAAAARLAARDRRRTRSRSRRCQS